MNSDDVADSQIVIEISKHRQQVTFYSWFKESVNQDEMEKTHKKNILRMLDETNYAGEKKEMKFCQLTEADVASSVAWSVYDFARKERAFQSFLANLRDPFRPLKYVTSVESSPNKQLTCCIKYTSRAPSDDEKTKVHQQLEKYFNKEFAFSRYITQGDVDHYSDSYQSIKLVNDWTITKKDIIALKP